MGIPRHDLAVTRWPGSHALRRRGDLLVEELVHLVHLRTQECDSVATRRVSHCAHAKAEVASDGLHTSPWTQHASSGTTSVRLARRVLLVPWWRACDRHNR